jgi:4-diphosphocytidyl-2-C-methyl-D-erythritol kinase
VKLSRASGAIRVRVPAKVNLYLDVVGKRTDGYHELVTVMHPVSLFDELICRRSSAVRVRGDLEELGEHNLVVKAVRAIQSFARTRRGMEVRLRKRIPTGAGLGGGSADAAAALAAYHELHRLNFSARELETIAASVGSDVAFFLCGRTALCTGRGEIVQPVRVGRRLDVVLCYPGFESSTADAYRRLKLGLTPSRSDVNTFLEPLAEGDLRRIGRGLFNRLETPAFQIHPPLRALKRGMESLGFSGVLMSGSGSSMFGLCRSREEARAKARRISELGYGKVWTASSI